MSDTLSEIAEVTAEIKQLEEQCDGLRARRLQLLIEGREQTPPIGYKRLGDAAQMSDVGVMQILRRTGNHQPKERTNG